MAKLDQLWSVVLSQSPCNSNNVGLICWFLCLFLADVNLKVRFQFRQISVIVFLSFYKPPCWLYAAKGFSPKFKGTGCLDHDLSLSSLKLEAIAGYISDPWGIQRITFTSRDRTALFPTRCASKQWRSKDYSTIPPRVHSLFNRSNFPQQCSSSSMLESSSSSSRDRHCQIKSV